MFKTRPHICANLVNAAQFSIKILNSLKKNEGIIISYSLVQNSSTTKAAVCCQSCGCVVYCSTACRQSDMNDHADECRLLVNNMGSMRYFVDDKVRLLVRIYLKNKVNAPFYFLVCTFRGFAFIQLFFIQPRLLQRCPSVHEWVPTDPPTKRALDDLMDHCQTVSDKHRLTLDYWLQTKWVLGR